MTRLGFYLARTLRNEKALAGLGLPMAFVLNEMQGNLALVGNAQSLGTAAHGAAIDAADLVIRLNRAPMPTARSHGTRTDVLACATALKPTHLHQLNPKFLLWMSPKRKRLSWAMATQKGFALPPLFKMSSIITYKEGCSNEYGLRGSAPILTMNQRLLSVILVSIMENL
jgi:hypothetical protein